jgi:predicted metal-dependent hydrolase
MKHPEIEKDEKLKAAAAAFISQEAVHGREHECEWTLLWPCLLSSNRGFFSQFALFPLIVCAWHLHLGTTDYNNKVAEQFPLAKVFEQTIEKRAASISKRASPAVQLALTCGMEHWTAIMGWCMLRYADQFYGNGQGQPSRLSRFGLIWQWHACEETEHKAVAFDVYEKIYGQGQWH